MSGHSKWHNIQKTKGAADAKRAQAFTKIAREMIVAVKEGGVKAEVPLRGGFPVEEGVTGIVGEHTLHNAVTAKVDILEGICPEGFICADTVVTGLTITGAQLD